MIFITTNGVLNDIERIEKMKTYIGCKIINAEPMSHNEFLTSVKGKREIAVDEPGYKVVYPDNYESWSPKEVFEIAYREITPGELELLKIKD